jgi:hypothetical protein
MPSIIAEAVMEEEFTDKLTEQIKKHLLLEMLFLFYLSRMASTGFFLAIR